MRSADHARDTELAAIAARFGMADIYVFGSRADEVSAGAERSAGTASQSDVDIGVRPQALRAIPPKDRVELTLALERALGVSRVDLLVLPEASPLLALAAIRGNLLFCADPVDQAEYELFVLRRAGDLAPLEHDRQQIVFGGGR
jgi:predicted nucleotidyltransferase